MDDDRQLQVFPDRLLMRRIDTEKHLHRFYRMTVQRDLFNGASLIREWGQIGSPGRVRVEYHPDEGQALNALAEIASEKTKRGYQR